MKHHRKTKASTKDSNSEPVHSLKILKNINKHKNKEEMLFILSSAAVIKERQSNSSLFSSQIMLIISSVMNV